MTELEKKIKNLYQKGICRDYIYSLIKTYNLDEKSIFYQFKVGDMVRVINEVDGMCLKGMVAKIVAKKNNYSLETNGLDEMCYGLEFSVDLYDGHNCDGCCSHPKSGRWCLPYEIEKI